MTIDELKNQIALCRLDCDEAEALARDNERGGRAAQFNNPYVRPNIYEVRRYSISHSGLC
jgi:hypothetical protein